MGFSVSSQLRSADSLSDTSTGVTGLSHLKSGEARERMKPDTADPLTPTRFRRAIPAGDAWMERDEVSQAGEPALSVPPSTLISSIPSATFEAVSIVTLIGALHRSMSTGSGCIARACLVDRRCTSPFCAPTATTGAHRFRPSLTHQLRQC